MSRIQIDLPAKLRPVFSGKARYRGAHGGRGSGKTKSFALMTAVKGYQYGRMGVSGLILCGREHLKSLEESSLEEVKWAIQKYPFLSAYYEIGDKYVRSRDRRITYSFSGLRHNISSVKSKANILIAWIDEAEEVPETSWLNLIPTVRAEGPGWNSEIWATWNRAKRDSATNVRFSDEEKVAQVNWSDNPWFPEVLNEERLNHMAKFPETYEHVWEGDYLELTEAQVFNGLYETSHFDVEAHWDGPYHGFDFGFSQDPAAAVQAYIHDDCLYIRREGFKKGLELDYTAGFLTRQIPRIAMHVIRADSSRPESISYLARHGLPLITAAKKWPGSIEDGVEFIKQFRRVIIHPDCPNIAREFAMYSYKVDRLTGDIMPVIIDAHNHGIDALRYALAPLIRSRGRARIRSL